MDKNAHIGLNNYNPFWEVASTGTSKDDKSLKLFSDSVSEDMPG